MTIALVGDILPGGRQIPGRLGELTRTADLCVANLECPVSHRGEPLACKLVPGEWAFRVAPETARRCLRAWGVDMVSVANNHTLDYGSLALADTLAVVRAAGIECAGAGGNVKEAVAPAIVDCDGLRVGLLAFVGDDTLPTTHDFAARDARPGLSVVAVGRGEVSSGCKRVAERVRALRLRADVVIVALHTGIEASGVPTEAQRRLARAAIRAGADIVIGHHPHRLQPLEVCGGGIVAYSLGNFIFPPARALQAHTGVLLVRVGAHGVTGAGFVPAVIQGRTPHLAGERRLRHVIAGEVL